MVVDNTIPSSYEPLPPICSETLHKYRWPFTQTREPYQLEVEDVKTSLDGPQKSSLPPPRLRYHRQSTYTDAYGMMKPFHLRGYTLEADWLDPVGKHGDFYGVSTYENDYSWPDEPSKMPRLPMVSTIGWGILPIVGSKTDSKNICLKEEIGKKVKSDSAEKVKDIQAKKGYISKDFVPLQDIWSGETIYRSDFLNPPKRWRMGLTKPPVPELKFSGNIETSTTTMQDYQDPKHVKHEEYFVKHPVQEKSIWESRYPFFLF